MELIKRTQLLSILIKQAFKDNLIKMASEADSAITTTPDFTILKDLVRSHFLQTLQEIPGEKLLMLDPEVSPFFRVMVGKAEKGLIKDTILLEPDCIIDVETPVVVFALKPSVPLLKTIVKLITETESDKRFLAFFCPRYTSLCKQVFEEGKIIKSITVHEFPYELIPLERDVLTLDDNNGFNNLIMGKDYTSLQWVKHSLNRLEALCGRIPIKYAKGPWSCIVHDSLLSNKEKDQGNSDSDIDALILLDRTVDLFTPLVTQMTYEGIIDEFYGIKCGSIEVDRKVLDPDAKDVKENEKKTLCLTSQEDIFFGESRDKNFNIMKEFFPKKYEEMKSLCEKKDAFKTLAEMTEYIKQLRGLKIPQLQAFYNLSTNCIQQLEIDFNMLAHLDTLVIKHNFKQMVSMEPKVILADTLPKEVIDFLELEIAKCEEKERLLRLLCLLSLTNNGLPKDAYNLLMKEFIDAFGIAELMRVLNLEKVGLLKKKESGGLQWGLIKTVTYSIM
eukprot:TRINITY_DN2012_c0_g1_i1.p2 TRINITY_DN2012_c0_g1~~TRINITY_DN2012_c0_g1_i1.p2  ORF type:complete len:503 (-),score=63.72 TRINITY_DN2012_c0_g1_i1:2036-3544(-)